MNDLEIAFTGTVVEWRGPAPFYFVPVPEEQAAGIAEVAMMATYGWGCVPVQGRVAGHAFTTSLIPRNGGYFVPLKVAIRKATGIDVDDVVKIELTIRVAT